MVAAFAMEFAELIAGHVACYRCHRAYDEDDDTTFCVRSQTKVDKKHNLTDFTIFYLCKDCGIVDAAEGAAEYRDLDDPELHEARDILRELRDGE